MAPEAATALTPTRRAALVKHRACDLGFASAGITDLAPTPHADALDRWLATGLAGTMRYMHRQAAARKAPGQILPGATRAVVLTRPYPSDEPPPMPSGGRVARYARGPDYHTTLQPALTALADYIRSLGPPVTRARAYVDAGPVPERELAQRAGLGWIGKNTMLIDPARGSYCFLASVLTDLDLATDPPFAADRCGSCTRCLEACPTNAFPAPRVLDATRCISYLTIEHRDEIAPPVARLMGDWIFGCDVCQEVCPWNEKFAEPITDGELQLDPGRAWLPLDAFATLDDATFDERYGWTPLERPGLTGMRRNASIAAANSGREALWPNR
ncbi:MAG: tRNA epoxyqueuosine(34) reductase QueG [Gemmatimonadota bacterium]|nr:tRNA epoxyqueuosine(34) reductase QueG [Gemmatimonadota bacterium]